MFKELITKNRSYRRFYEEEMVSKETLLALVDYARLSASGANMQPLSYFISFEKEVNAVNLCYNLRKGQDRRFSHG